MTWKPLRLKILDVWFTYNLEGIEKMNPCDKYLEARILFNCWAKRSNTPIGRDSYHFEITYIIEIDLSLEHAP